MLIELLFYVFCFVLSICALSAWFKAAAAIVRAAAALEKIAKELQKFRNADRDTYPPFLAKK